MDGFFNIAFTGIKGSGFGMLILQQGTVSGADTTGAMYDGSYTEDAESGRIDFHVMTRIPAGVTPVQTGIPLASPLTVPFDGAIAEHDIATERPVLLQTPLGAVNVVFRKVRDLPA